MFLYSQSLFDSRWFLPEKFRGKENDFYKTKEEVIANKPDSEFVRYKKIFILKNKLSLNA